MLLGSDGQLDGRNMRPLDGRLSCCVQTLILGAWLQQISAMPFWLLMWWRRGNGC